MTQKRKIIHPTLFAIVCLAATAAEQQIRVGAEKQLFLDDYLIASQVNLTRQIHPASKYFGNPVLWPKESWEPAYAATWGSVLRDQGKYKVWYRTPVGVSYAESDDGIAWIKPRLDLVVQGKQKTNILIRKAPNNDLSGQKGDLPYFYSLLGVHKDDGDPDPNRRYKLGFLSIERGYQGTRQCLFFPNQRRGLGVAGSPDGLHWTLIDNWATEAIADGPCHWMIDPARNKYVFYGRTYLGMPADRIWNDNVKPTKYHGSRSVARVESSDFLNWNIVDPAKSPMIMAPDTFDMPGDEIYSMKVFPYEGIYIGLVQVFHNRPDACYLDVQLAVSRDSYRFTRVGNRETFLPVGGMGTWDRFNISLANNDPITVDDELRIYYGCMIKRHSPYSGKDTGPVGGGLGFATVKRDRFVSLGASFDGGELLTKPVQLLGNRLHLNTKSDFGEIVIEVLNGEGKRIARSKPVSTDSLNAVVEWAEGGLERMKDPVVLRITLKNALVFALWST